MRVLEIKIFALCFGYLHSQFMSAGGKNLCFVFWLPPFSIYESAGGKNLCFNLFYHQNSYKLRIEVAKHKINIFTTRTPTN
jgi:hypothetical protein